MSCWTAGTRRSGRRANMLFRLESGGGRSPAPECRRLDASTPTTVHRMRGSVGSRVEGPRYRAPAKDPKAKALESLMLF